MDNEQAAREDAAQKEWPRSQKLRLTDLSDVFEGRLKRQADTNQNPDPVPNTYLPVSFKEAPSLEGEKINSVVRFLASGKIKTKGNEGVILEMESIDIIPQDQIAGENGE